MGPHIVQPVILTSRCVFASVGVCARACSRLPTVIFLLGTAVPRVGLSLNVSVPSVRVFPRFERSLGHVRGGGAFWRLTPT